MVFVRMAQHQGRQATRVQFQSLEIVHQDRVAPARVHEYRAVVRLDANRQAMLTPQSQALRYCIISDAGDLHPRYALFH